MGNIFSYDNKVLQWINKMVDCFFISVLWVIFSLPVVTMGAATTAMYYTVHKVLRNNRDYVWHSFWSAFKSNFKQSTIMWLICLAAGIIFAGDAYFMQQMFKNGVQAGILSGAFLMLLFLLVLWSCYLFTYTARFENTITAIMKNCAIIAVANLPWTFLIAVILIVTLVIMMIIPAAVFVLPGFTCWSLNAILERIYRKYMTEEDLEQEKETDMEITR